ncbi:uncharacterized protein LOC130781099 isoform X1 [Actinidia eriantha]|uniref:uncharacterized protein LOC130781099 isoform X1 n=1 Tax=Actinidia eriantha TaxID=165200 RepID=UPI0025847B98|nr:uncharacterized protein LOC130781099 isoform X1 [Actinidia eriantha]
MALRGPQMLKDLLADGSNSCSSSGFRSFPRKVPSNLTVRNLLDLNLDLDLTTNTKRTSSIKLTRSRSIFHNAVKYFPFIAVKSPSVLRRSISRRLSRRELRDDVVRVASVAVTVKDILRWRSFRDLAEERSPPLDFSSSRTTTTMGSTVSPAPTNLCESDFTAEDLPFWRGEWDKCLESEVGKNCLPEMVVGGGDSTVDPKGELSCDQDKEQHSPVSVHNFPFQDEESLLSSHQNLANLERRKQMLMQNTQDFECLPESSSDCELEEGNGIEERARQLVSHVKAASSVETCETGVDRLIFDFFCHELATRRNRNDDDEFDSEVLRVAEAWMGGKYEESLEWEEEGKRGAYIRDMEGGGRWRKVEEEREDVAMAVELEVGVLDYLVDELLVDLSSSVSKQQAKVN